MINNWINDFDREIEILDMVENRMIYVMDQKSETGNCCELGCIDWENGKRTTFAILPGTRIYESFQNYRSCLPYFYAVSVRDDYTVSLSEVDKDEWKLKTCYEIFAEGEIINIFPLHDHLLVVTDEMPATDELLEKMQDEDFSGRYYTISYVYDLKSGKKRILNNVLKGGDIENAVDLSISEDKSVLYLIVKEQNGKRLVSLDLMHIFETDDIFYENDIHYITEGAEIDFLDENINGIRYAVWNNKTGKACIMTVSRNNNNLLVDQEENVDFAGAYGQVMLVDDQPVFYSISEKEKNEIINAATQEIIYSFDQDDGEFEGVCDGQYLVTKKYEEKIVRDELLFKECVVLHNMTTGIKTEFDGKAVFVKNHICILKSYLFL